MTSSVVVEQTGKSARSAIETGTGPDEGQESWSTSREIGDYHSLMMRTDVSQFNGTVTFFMHRTFESLIFEFTFRHGHLSRKEWGYLPG